MNRTQILLVVLIAITFLIGTAALFFLQHHDSFGNQKGTFYIDTDFDKVRKIMVRNDCLEEIVSYQHGEVLDQDWEDLDVSMVTLRQWDIDGIGRLIVKTEDPEAGTLILPFEQKVRVRKDSIKSHTYLTEQVKYLKDYQTKVEMSRDGDRTKVVLEVSLEYGRKLPASYVEYMDTKVQESADQGWLKAKEAFQAVVAKYRDRRFTIPLRD
jgi:hypothetical protein